MKAKFKSIEITQNLELITGCDVPQASNCHITYISFIIAGQVITITLDECIAGYLIGGKYNPPLEAVNKN